MLIHCVNAVICFKQLQEEEVVLLVVEEAEGVEEVEEGEEEDDLMWITKCPMSIC